MARSLHIVCGAGETGMSIASELLKQGYRVVVVDIDQEALDRITDPQEGLSTYRGDALDDDVLREIGIDEAEGLFATLTQDRENALLSLSARRLSPGLNIVARAKDPETEPKFRLVGVNAAVNTSRVEGLRLAGVMLRPNVVSLTDQMLFNPECEHTYCSFQVASTSEACGKRIHELDITGRTGVVLIALRRASGRMVYNPGPKEKIQPGDSLIAFVTEQEAQAITDHLK